MFITVLGIAVACAVSPPIKETIVGALTGIAGAIYTPVSGFWAYLGSVAGATGLNFLITFLVIFISGFITGPLLYRKLKQISPWKPAQSGTNINLNLQRDVTPTPIQTVAKKEEEKPVEAT